MDRDEERVKQVSDFVTRAYIADALDEKALEEAGIFNADTVVVSIGENIEASILVAVLLINRGVREIVAKAVNPLHGEVLRRIGVPRVVYPEREVAVRVAKSLLIEGMVEELPLAPGVNLYEIKAPRKITGRTLKDLDLRNRYGVNVVAIKRGGRIIPNPSAEDRIEEGDLILILSREEDLRRLTSQ
ncbi:MAG: TrkA family potassium uptake protein [Aquificota bacterium]|nr:TrkA family potassium uptake protein [Aquificota bacterium]